MNKQWTDDSNLKCVLLCAGEGRRLRPLTTELPKVLNPVNGRPILHYVVDYWRRYTRDFIFVVHYRKDDVIKFVRTLPVNYMFVEQKELKGIADAVAQAKPFIENKFILALGDCVCDGEFSFPVSMQQGVAIWETGDMNSIRRSYSVELDGYGRVNRVVEKPKFLPNKLCGLGYYFFNNKVFDYIKRTEPSSLRNEVEITDVIQNMINNNEDIAAVPYQGNYINVTAPEDLHKVETIVSRFIAAGV